MFTWTTTPVAFVGLLLLFGFSALWSLVTLWPRRDWDTTMAKIIGVLFSASAGLMVAPPTADWLFHLAPDPALGFIFGLFTLWFIVESVVRRGSSSRSYAVVALLMVTMTWHVAAMSRATRDGLSAAQMGDPQVYRAAAQRGDALWVMAWVGVPLAVGLLVAAVRGAIGVVTAPGVGTADAEHHGQFPAWRRRGNRLSQLTASVGLLWSSAALLTPALPFMAWFIG